jgi:hypothetical protein
MANTDSIINQNLTIDKEGVKSSIKCVLIVFIIYYTQM